MSTPPEKKCQLGLPNNSQPHPQNLNPAPKKLPTPPEKMSPLPKNLTPSDSTLSPENFSSPPTKISQLPPENFSNPPKILQSPPQKNFSTPPIISQPPPENFSTPPPKISQPPPENFSTPPKISQTPPRKFLKPPTKISQPLPKISQPLDNFSTPPENISTPLKKYQPQKYVKRYPHPPPQHPFFFFLSLFLHFSKKNLKISGGGLNPLNPPPLKYALANNSYHSYSTHSSQFLQTAMGRIEAIYQTFTYIGSFAFNCISGKFQVSVLNSLIYVFKNIAKLDIQSNNLPHSLNVY